VSDLESAAQRACKGDRGAEEELLRLLRPGVLAVLRYGTFRNLIDAEDVAQDALKIVLERVREGTINEPDKLYSFAANTARNLALNMARKVLRQKTAVDSPLLDELAQTVGDEQTEVDDEQLARAVVALLDQLPTLRDRHLLRRFYVEGIDKQTLCTELSLTAAHFDRVLMRARDRFRLILQREGPRLGLVVRITGFLLPVINFASSVRFPS
jgi:RNA polymerase sigma-70 factor (ECF subfamily)